MYGGDFMEFKINEVYHGFKLLVQEEVKENQSTARVFYHIKSGARLLHLENEDDNKLFSIGFRTTPTDNTGVAHILEHSVLCGSKKFRSKDPFGNLAKSSLNTFLNAMTYTDKTIYPVSSRNHKDFMNLMDVYLDAVLNPRIYDNHEILRQEGWRYESETEKDKLIYKGVVYSEMQGALSSPQEMIAKEIYGTLFPNTTYEFVSGGDPEYIPELTQGDFESFHSKFYHPSNSYIVLYGDQHLDQCLKFINDEYLINFNKIDIPSKIEYVQPFETMCEINSKYSISEEENEKNKTFLGLNFAFEETRNGESYLATKILYNMFIESSASPIKEALLKAGIGECIITMDDMNMDPTRQMIFPIVVKNTEASKKEEFKNIVFDTLRNIVRKGLNRNLLEAAINTIEFELREADPWRIANKGIQYNERILNSWLYDGDPLVHLKYEENLRHIKANIEKGYFEDFIEKWMLNNHHSSLVVLSPEKGLKDKKNRVLEEKLESYRKSLSKAELEDLNERNRRLKEEQIRVETLEEKESMPRISLEEIDKKAEEIPQEIIENQGVTILNHPIFTNKINYVTLAFDTKHIKEEYIPYLGLLGDCLGEVNTEKRTYIQLITEIFKKTGGITFGNGVYIDVDNIENYHTKFIVKGKVIAENIGDLLTLIKEIMTDSNFDDKNRVKQIIQEIKSKLQMKIIDAGHRVAMDNIYSKFSYGNRYRDMVSGRLYYEFICNLERDFEKEGDSITENIKEVYRKIFNKNNLIVSIVGEKEHNEKVISNLNSVLDNISQEKVEAIKVNHQILKDIEGIITGSNVQFVAKGFNMKEVGGKYSGKLRVLENIIDSEYLYPRVRLQGGAYGCFMELDKCGNVAFTSYRDPNLSRTIDVYNKTYEFIEKLNLTEKDMETFIIGAVGKRYRPLTPERKGDIALENYICSISNEYLQKEKNELLNITLEDLKYYKEIFKKGMENNYCCVVGSEEKIKENKSLFDKISNAL